MTWVAGVDGCRGGWVVALREVETGRLRIRRAAAIADALTWEEAPAVLCVDVPIGLLDVAVPGGRVCDRKARALLKHPRASSVFSPPARPALCARNHEEALQLSRASSNVGISRQCFGIFDKLREIDAWMTPTLQKRVFEAHPELCFCHMNGSAVVEGKRTLLGRRRRLGLLQDAWGPRGVEVVEAHRSGAARDDVLDALATCWTAERVLRNETIRLPDEPPYDSRGLRMEIVR